jgi:hypothetical protein
MVTGLNGANIWSCIEGLSRFLTLFEFFRVKFWWELLTTSKSWLSLKLKELFVLYCCAFGRSVMGIWCTILDLAAPALRLNYDTFYLLLFYFSVIIGRSDEVSADVLGAIPPWLLSCVHNFSINCGRVWSWLRSVIAGAAPPYLAALSLISIFTFVLIGVIVYRCYPSAYYYSYFCLGYPKGRSSLAESTFCDWLTAKALFLLFASLTPTSIYGTITTSFTYSFCNCAFFSRESWSFLTRFGSPLSKVINVFA